MLYDFKLHGGGTVVSGLTTDALVLPILAQVRMRYSVTPPIGSTSLWCSVWSRSRVDFEDVLREEAKVVL